MIIWSWSLFFFPKINYQFALCGIKLKMQATTIILECRRAGRGAGSSEIPQGSRLIVDVLHIQNTGLTEGSHKTRVADNLQNKVYWLLWHNNRVRTCTLLFRKQRKWREGLIFTRNLGNEIFVATKFKHSKVVSAAAQTCK